MVLTKLPYKGDQMRKTTPFPSSAWGTDRRTCSQSLTFLTTGTPLKWQWPSALQSRSAHPSPMPSSSCRCWKARRPWWAPWAKDKPSSPPSTSWEVTEHWAPSVSTCLGCGLPAWAEACVAVASKRLNFQWKSKLDTVLDPSDAVVIMCLIRLQKPVDWMTFL